MDSWVQVVLFTLVVMDLLMLVLIRSLSLRGQSNSVDRVDWKTEWRLRRVTDEKPKEPKPVELSDPPTNESVTEREARELVEKGASDERVGLLAEYWGNSVKWEKQLDAFQTRRVWRLNDPLTILPGCISWVQLVVAAVVVAARGSNDHGAVLVLLAPAYTLLHAVNVTLSCSTWYRNCVKDAWLEQAVMVVLLFAVVVTLGVRGGADTQPLWVARGVVGSVCYTAIASISAMTATNTSYYSTVPTMLPILHDAAWAVGALGSLAWWDSSNPQPSASAAIVSFASVDVLCVAYATLQLARGAGNQYDVLSTMSS